MSYQSQHMARIGFEYAPEAVKVEPMTTKRDKTAIKRRSDCKEVETSYHSKRHKGRRTTRNYIRVVVGIQCGHCGKVNNPSKQHCGNCFHKLCK